MLYLSVRHMIFAAADGHFARDIKAWPPHSLNVMTRDKRTGRITRSCVALSTRRLDAAAMRSRLRSQPALCPCHTLKDFTQRTAFVGS